MSYIRTNERGWIDIISSGDAQSLWTRLYDVISRHSSVRTFLSFGKAPSDGLTDLRADLTQDLVLRLIEKDRFRVYLDHGYNDETVEHELYDIELPNLVSLQLRKRFPESYRLARRISKILSSSPEFQYYSADRPGGGNRRSESSCKLVLKVYGLAWWPRDKAVKDDHLFPELIADVAFRRRNNRNAGRGRQSQLIITNEDLNRLIVEILAAIDSPADVRTIRALALSKLPVEDSRFTSIDAETVSQKPDNPKMTRVDLPDHRPTPEEVLLAKETAWLAEQAAADLILSMRTEVLNKPRRLYRLAKVAWHCYFDPLSPSQTSIARIMGISNSLVSHYRKIFDDLVRRLDFNPEQMILLNAALEQPLAEIIASTGMESRAGESIIVQKRGHRQASDGFIPCMAASGFGAQVLPLAS
ncbi:MAG TPA: hypothetical protein VN345_10030 [Blastocatellia bacterium]|nr:hypothetical protein [Blastocatellia bacterium]